MVLEGGLKRYNTGMKVGDEKDENE